MANQNSIEDFRRLYFVGRGISPDYSAKIV